MIKLGRPNLNYIMVTAKMPITTKLKAMFHAWCKMESFSEYLRRAIDIENQKCEAEPETPEIRKLAEVFKKKHKDLLAKVERRVNFDYATKKTESQRQEEVGGL